jgi:hypothetical protein
VWTASGTIGVVRVEVPAIIDADKFFEDATARQLQPPTIAKHTILLKKRLWPWCANKGNRLPMYVAGQRFKNFIEFRSVTQAVANTPVSCSDSKSEPLYGYRRRKS